MQKTLCDITKDFDIICNMEYQSFFMILKDYKIVDGKFCSVNPIAARGFVMLKKELNKYFLIVELNGNHEQFFVCSGEHVISGILQQKTTKIELNFEPNINKIVVIVPALNLFATKTSTEECEKAIAEIDERKNKSLLQKVFGEVYDTYFFDSIKPKLAKLFELGEKTSDFDFLGGKWIRLYVRGEEKIFGIVYKNKFAHAIAVGELQNNQKPVANLIKAAGKIYNIVFMSAADGKYLQV